MRAKGGTAPALLALPFQRRGNAKAEEEGTSHIDHAFVFATAPPSQCPPWRSRPSCSLLPPFAFLAPFFIDAAEMLLFMLLASHARQHHHALLTPPPPPPPPPLPREQHRTVVFHKPVGTVTSHVAQVSLHTSTKTGKVVLYFYVEGCIPALSLFHEAYIRNTRYCANIRLYLIVFLDTGQPPRRDADGLRRAARRAPRRGTI